METVACPECDLLQRIPELPPGAKARCPRCGSTLATRPTDPLDRPLALTIAAADRPHRRQYDAADGPLGGRAPREHDHRRRRATRCGSRASRSRPSIVAFCAVIAPASYILFMLTVLLAVRRPPAPHWVGEMLRWARLHASRGR